MIHDRSQRPGCSRFSTRWPPATQRDPRPLPIAHVDRIEDAATALAMFDAFASDPPIYETLAILLDREHRGSTVVNVAGTVDPDSVLAVADFLTDAAHLNNAIDAAIIASFRPGGSDELDDIDRWLAIDDQLSVVGIELVEWFVIAGSVSCPRSLLGDAPRWS